MHYHCYKLCIKHILPKTVSKITILEQPYREVECFRLEIPVGIAVVQDSDDEKWWLHLIESPETFLWEILLASVPVSKADFLHALNTIHFPLCVHQESCHCYGDVTEMLDYKRDEVEVAYYKACQSLYLEVYERN